ncbi:MAG: hypothetical protein ABI268_04145 [Rhodanobacter sp.]
MDFHISEKIVKKLAGKEPPVDPRDVQEAFANRTGKLLFDERDKHKTNPRTLWFVALTNHRRLLKVCFIPKADGPHIRTAYSANDDELRIYRKYGEPSDF